jgi:hypothetical protein
MDRFIARGMTLGFLIAAGCYHVGPLDVANDTSQDAAADAATTRGQTCPYDN